MYIYEIGLGLTSSTCMSCSIGIKDNSPPNIGAGGP